MMINNNSEIKYTGKNEKNQKMSKMFEWIVAIISVVIIAIVILATCVINNAESTSSINMQPLGAIFNFCLVVFLISMLIWGVLETIKGVNRLFHRETTNTNIQNYNSQTQNTKNNGKLYFILAIVVILIVFLGIVVAIANQKQN